MWMSLVEMKVWMRGRSESLMAFQAASTSCGFARARPQITGPCTSRAMAWTASKSPGEEIGKPASITSTPRRASWCAISSFSCLLSEIPGDCSPSRRVVSKIFTRSFSLRSMSLLLRRWPSSHALVHPPKGRSGESRRPARANTQRRVPAVLSGLPVYIAAKSDSPRPLHRSERQHDLANVVALVHVAVRRGAVVEAELPGHDRSQAAVGDPVAERVDQLLQRLLGVPEREHVQPDH